MRRYHVTLTLLTRDSIRLVRRVALSARTRGEARDAAIRRAVAPGLRVLSAEVVAR